MYTTNHSAKPAVKTISPEDFSAAFEILSTEKWMELKSADSLILRVTNENMVESANWGNIYIQLHQYKDQFTSLYFEAIQNKDKNMVPKVQRLLTALESGIKNFESSITEENTVNHLSVTDLINSLNDIQDKINAFRIPSIFNLTDSENILYNQFTKQKDREQFLTDTVTSRGCMKSARALVVRKTSTGVDKLHFVTRTEQGVIEINRGLRQAVQFHSVTEEPQLVNISARAMFSPKELYADENEQMTRLQEEKQTILQSLKSQMFCTSVESEEDVTNDNNCILQPYCIFFDVIQSGLSEIATRFSQLNTNNIFGFFSQNQYTQVQTENKTELSQSIR